MMGCNGTGFAWYGTAGGMGAFFFRFGLHDTLFALRPRYTIEAVHIVSLLLRIRFPFASSLYARSFTCTQALVLLNWPVIMNSLGSWAAPSL
jgi:hypothetical protein